LIHDGDDDVMIWTLLFLVEYCPNNKEKMCSLKQHKTYNVPIDNEDGIRIYIILEI